MMFPQMAESHNKKTTPSPVLDGAGYALVTRQFSTWKPSRTPNFHVDYSLYSFITGEKFRRIAIILDPPAHTGRAFPGITLESERNALPGKRRRYGTLAG
jgi:hypothetical protein